MLSKDVRDLNPLTPHFDVLINNNDDILIFLVHM